MDKRVVRTRFAPSPTGFMHVGNLRTALYEYLIAKSQGGCFVLRIEDTDQERLVEGAVQVIYRTLEQVGLKHDEGPDVGGEYGPYVQSERKDLYRPYAEPVSYTHLDVDKRQLLPSVLSAPFVKSSSASRVRGQKFLIPSV